MPLKMKPEHLTALRDAIVPLDTRDRRTQYIRGEFSNADRTTNVAMRYRWDLMWIAAKVPYLPTIHWVYDTLYEYLDDTHIDSALREILGMDHRSMLIAEDARAGTCADCGGSGRGGVNTTDGGAHDDCSACSGTGKSPASPDPGSAPLGTEEVARLEYLARCRASYAWRAIESHGEHSPSGPMGTAERLACNAAWGFERRYGDELNQLLLRRAQTLETTP